jgi:hypothetical protein
MSITSTRPNKSGAPAALVAAGVLAALAAALAAALVPALAGLALLGSVAVRRPALAALAERWPRPAGPDPRGDRVATCLTIAWGLGLLAVGAVQAIGALAWGLSITDPVGLLLRTLLALGGEALLALATVVYARTASAG